jgi:branched-chain amino acid transport system permease protein
MIEEIILFGAIQGGLYALLALGFTLIYGIAGVVNLAHGSFYMLGAYMFFVFQKSGLLGPVTIEASILAIILAVIFVAFVGSVIYRLIIHPVLGDEVAVMVVTICVALIFQQLILVIFGTSFPPIGWPADSFLARTYVKILGVNLLYSRIAAFAASLALFGTMLVLIAKTKIGKAMRAVSQDREVAMLMGINTTRLYMLTMGISALLAATASILITTSTGTGGGAWLWLHPLALSFSIVILGGLGSIKGSLLGGFIIGYAEQTVAFAVPEGGAIVGVVPLAVMAIVLLLRPKGLFGKRIEMEE